MWESRAIRGAAVMTRVERAYAAGWRPEAGWPESGHLVHPVLSPQTTVDGCLRASEAYEKAIMAQDGYVDSHTLLPATPDTLPEGWL